MSIQSGLFGPISDVEGFSMRDGSTHLEIQKKMRKVLLDLMAAHNTIVGQVREANGVIEADYASRVAVFDNLLTSYQNLDAQYVTLAAQAQTTIANVLASAPLNVREFGAVGDGVADDSAHIQAALNEAGVGGRVVIPKGVYRCLTGITVPTFCTLEGSTAEFNTSGVPVATELTFPNLTGTDVAVTFAGNGTLRNILVRGPGATVGSVIGTKSTNSVRFDRVSVCEFVVGSEIDDAYYAQMYESEWLRNGTGVVMANCYNVNMFAPRFSCVTAVDSGSVAVAWGTAISGKARGLNIFGGSIESYSVGIETVNASHYMLSGVYFEASSGSSAVGIQAINSTNVSVDLAGCMIYLFAHLSFVRFTGSQHFILNSRGNRFSCADTSPTTPTVFNGVSGFSNTVDIGGDSWVEVLKTGTVYAAASLINGRGCRIAFPPTYPLLGGYVLDGRPQINATVNIDLAAAGAVPDFDLTYAGTTVTLYDNATSSVLPSGLDGQFYTVTFKQYTSGKTYVWPTNCKFAGASAPSDTTASRQSSVTFRCKAGIWYEISRAVAVG